MVQEYGRYFGMQTCCLRGGCLTGPNHSGVELHGFLSYLVRCNIEGRTLPDLRLQGQAGPRQHPLPRRRALHRGVLEGAKDGRGLQFGRRPGKQRQHPGSIRIAAAVSGKKQVSNTSTRTGKVTIFATSAISRSAVRITRTGTSRCP